MNFNCTPKKTNNELIIGNWELDSINKHSDGVDRIIKVDNDENLFVGSFTNRIYFKFSKYNESFIYCKKYSTEKRFSKFEIIKDSIVTKSFGNHCCPIKKDC